MDNIIELDLYTLNDIILSQHYTNSAYKTNWLNFRNYLGQYERDKQHYRKRGLPHLLLDFYWRAYMKIKYLKELFKNYEIDIIEDCSSPVYKNDTIHKIKSSNNSVKNTIIYNVDKFINQQLNSNLCNIKEVRKALDEMAVNELTIPMIPGITK